MEYIVCYYFSPALPLNFVILYSHYRIENYYFRSAIDDFIEQVNSY